MTQRREPLARAACLFRVPRPATAPPIHHQAKYTRSRESRYGRGSRVVGAVGLASVVVTVDGYGLGLPVAHIRNGWRPRGHS